MGLKKTKTKNSSGNTGSVHNSSTRCLPGLDYNHPFQIEAKAKGNPRRCCRPIHTKKHHRAEDVAYRFIRISTHDTSQPSSRANALSQSWQATRARRIVVSFAHLRETFSCGACSASYQTRQLSPGGPLPPQAAAVPDPPKT